jgi:hypothetical protein
MLQNTLLTVPKLCHEGAAQKSAKTITIKNTKIECPVSSK